MTGLIVILSGPAAVGKDTLIDLWRAADPRVCQVVAYTTRERTPGETDGKDYHFVSVDRFKELAANGFFLEWKEVHGNFYGTPVRDMESLLNEGKITVLKIDVQGALEVIEKRPDAVTIFIDPPSMQVLEERIKARARPGDDVAQRLRNAREEIALAHRYQHRVVNDIKERAVDEIRQIVREAENTAQKAKGGK